MQHIMNVNINRILAIITITNTIILTREQSLLGMIINKYDKSDNLQQFINVVNKRTSHLDFLPYSQLSFLLTEK